MKKLLKTVAYIVMAVVLVSPVIFVSCDKDDSLVSEPVSTSKAVPGNEPGNDTTIYFPKTYRYYYDNGKPAGQGGEWGCIDAWHGCLDDVIIKPAKYNLIKKIAKTIEATPNNAPIVFKENYETVMDVFDEVFVNSLIDGKTSLTVRDETVSNPCIYFIFRSNFSNEEICVVPIRK